MQVLHPDKMMEKLFFRVFELGTPSREKLEKVEARGGMGGVSRNHSWLLDDVASSAFGCAVVGQQAEEKRAERSSLGDQRLWFGSLKVQKSVTDRMATSQVKH